MIVIRTFTDSFSGCCEHVKSYYIKSRFDSQTDKWQLLHPKHFVNVLFIYQTDRISENKILDFETIMRPGLALNKDDIIKGDISDTDHTPGLLEYFATSSKSKETYKSKITNDISVIFKPFIKTSDGSTTDPRFILIEGAPGMGKTTLCKEIASQWAEQHLLTNTKLLFLLHLRDPGISSIKHLKDLVHYFYTFKDDYTELSKQCAKAIIDSDGEGLTVLFDGFDEFDSSSDSLITNILYHKVLPKCSIVVTSRPTASDRLQGIADVRVQVMGFCDDESKTQYIEHELEDYPDKISKLQFYLDKYKSIKSVCYIPMMMRILVYVFKEKGHLPKNSTEMYEKFVAIAISNLLQKKKKSDKLFVSLQKLPREYKDFVINLSKVAFLTLQTKQNVFNEEDIHKLCPDLTYASSDLDTLDIINSVQFTSIDKGDVHVFNFLHLSIHEYLAAYYIGTLDQCGQFENLRNTFLNEKYQGTWTMFMAMNKTSLNFQNFSIYCKKAHYDSLKKWIGDSKTLPLFDCFIKLYDIINSKITSSEVLQILFSKDESNEMKAITCQCFYLSVCSPEKTKVELFIIDMAEKDVFNSDWYKLCMQLPNNGYSTIFSTGRILIFNKVNHKQMVDIFKSNTSIENIGFNDCHISESIIDAISHLQHISQFKVFSCYFEHNALIKLEKFLSNFNSLIEIKFHSCHFSTEEIDAISSVLSSNQYLQVLELNNNNLHNDIIKITEALKHIRKLEMLILANNNIPQSATAAISDVVSLNTSLRGFNIEGNNFKSSVEEILKSLSRITSLQKLNLNNNQIPVNCSEALASVVLHNKGLEELHVRDNDLGEGTLEVAKALRNITSLKILVLEGDGIPKESFSQLALALKSNKHLEKLRLLSNNLQLSAIDILQSLSTISELKSLNINDNQITEEAGETLASVVSHNKNLEELYLSGNNLGEGLLSVMKALRHIKSLKKLSLGNNDISKEVSGELACAIKANEYLEEIGLFASNLKSSAIIVLRSLTTISTLKYLNINNNHITEEAAEALASVILHNTGLEEIDISNNNLGEGTLKVAKALRRITSLRSLDFGNNNISKAAAGDLALAIKSNKHLEKLCLHDNNLNSSAIDILESLSTISSLKFLNVNNNQIGEAGGKELALVIKNNTRLRELYFRHNNIQNSVMEISEALQSISTIDTLDLGNNNLSERTCDKLALSSSCSTELQLHNNNYLQSSLIIMLKALDSTTKLKILNLYGNTITEEAGNTLASLISKNYINLQLLYVSVLTAPIKVIEALQKHSALEALLFDTCSLTEEAENKIASVITKNKSLRRLSLENINLSQTVIKSILTISKLTSLRLGDSSLSEEVCDNLSKAVSRNQSLETLVLLDNMLQTGLIKIVKACNKLSNIKVLQLAHNCIAPSKVVELTSIITQNTSLETVLLGGITLNAAECFHYNINEVLHKANIINDSCIKSYNHCTCLEVIYLEMLRLKIDNGKKCLNIVPIYLNAKNFCFGQKVYQYFQNNNITCIKTQEAKQKVVQIDTKKMILSLYILKKVKVIDLENSNIDENASFELATALFSNNVLEQLWLRGNKLNTTGAMCILCSLRHLVTLQVLDLSYNNIGSQSAYAIAAVIDNNPLMNQLWLDGNDLHSTGTITICNALKKIRTLSILSLCNNGITDDAADELSAVITQNVLLEDLMLSNNQLHSTGIKIIAESLSKLIKLRKLDLFNNDIGKEGASSLAIVIQNSTSLQDLLLSSNNLETSGALEICNALSHINSLHVLTLSNNNISDEVTSQLIEVLNNNHLYALLIGENGLECGGLKIAQVIENDNIAMQLLDFSNNNISEQDKKKIKVVFSKRANFKFYL